MSASGSRQSITPLRPYQADCVAALRGWAWHRLQDQEAAA